MKVVCVDCATEGKPALIGEKEPLDDPRVTHGICAEHQHRLARTMEESPSEYRPRVREPAAPDIEGKTISPLRLRDSGRCGYTLGGWLADPPARPKPILHLCRGKRTWLLSLEIVEGEGVRPYLTPILLPHDVDVETVLRMVQAEFPDYEIRVLNWQHPTWDYTQPD